MSIRKKLVPSCCWAYEIIDITAFLKFEQSPIFAYLICIVHTTIWKTTEFPYGLSISQMVDMFVGIAVDEW